MRRFLLLAKDGVPLPEVPRTLSSTVNGRTISDLILVSGQRVDILVMCSAPGRYALVSGAGPFSVHPGEMLFRQSKGRQNRLASAAA